MANLKPKPAGRMILILLRLAAGGHLFFQGMIKLFDPHWTSQTYLMNSSGIFQWISGQEKLTAIVDFLNIWGLILIGTALVLGLFERLAAIAGILLLGLYYLAYPPIEIFQGGGHGHGFLVNATLLELMILVLLFAMPTGRSFGMQRVLWSRTKKGEPDDRAPVEDMEKENLTGRRDMLKSLGTLPVLGVFGIPFMGRGFRDQIDARSGATKLILGREATEEYLRLKDLDLDTDNRAARYREEMSYGTIGDLKISRMISGSNLIGINMHARDLAYVNGLAQHYNTADRIMMTMKKMEEQGVNSIVLKDFNFAALDLKRYWTEWGGNMIWIADPITADFNKFRQKLEAHIELGCHAAYIWGVASDQWYANGEPDNIAKALEIIKSYHIPAGIGAHRNEPIAFAIQEDLQPDFFFKTFHHTDYWSAHPEEEYVYQEMYRTYSKNHNKYHDNLWCQHPEELAEMIREVPIPFIAFKTMAAGAIPPREAFDYAFSNGADFICAGMFDFQVDETMQHFRESVHYARDRSRSWA
jgi:hypothetical protein